MHLQQIFLISKCILHVKEMSCICTKSGFIHDVKETSCKRWYAKAGVVEHAPVSWVPTLTLTSYGVSVGLWKPSPQSMDNLGHAI